MQCLRTPEHGFCNTLAEFRIDDGSAACAPCRRPGWKFISTAMQKLLSIFIMSFTNHATDLPSLLHENTIHMIHGLWKWSVCRKIRWNFIRLSLCTSNILEFCLVCALCMSGYRDAKRRVRRRYRLCGRNNRPRARQRYGALSFFYHSFCHLFCYLILCSSASGITMQCKQHSLDKLNM